MRLLTAFHRRFTEKIKQLAVDVFRSLKTITLTEEEFQDELGKLKDSLKTTLLMDPYRLIYSKMVSLLLSYYSVDEKLEYLNSHVVTLQQVKDFAVGVLASFHLAPRPRVVPFGVAGARKHRRRRDGLADASDPEHHQGYSVRKLGPGRHVDPRRSAEDFPRSRGQCESELQQLRHAGVLGTADLTGGDGKTAGRVRTHLLLQ